MTLLRPAAEFLSDPPGWLSDRLYASDDALVWRAVGLIAAGALVLLWALGRLTKGA